MYLTIATYICAFLLSVSTPLRAAEVEPIKQAVTEFMEVQKESLPGKTHYRIGTINAGGLAAGCRSLLASMDSGARPWGRTHVNVRCTEGASWSLYVPIEVHVAVNYLVSARPLRAGQPIAESDIDRVPGDLAELPTGILTDPAQALGQSYRISLPANRPLRADMLSPPLVVRQGQSVKVVSEGAGFKVANEGRALNNAAAGQVVQVRLASGKNIRGIAKSDGTITVAH